MTYFMSNKRVDYSPNIERFLREWESLTIGMRFMSLSKGGFNKTLTQIIGNIINIYLGLVFRMKKNL